MSKRSKRNREQKHDKGVQYFDKDDPYGVLKQETEVDTDVNEDPNRERLLDESLEVFLEQEDET